MRINVFSEMYPKKMMQLGVEKGFQDENRYFPFVHVI